MLDIGFSELLIVAVVAIVVVGPKELPRAMKAVMGLVRKARSAAREFQSGIDELVREAELDEFKRELESTDVRKIADDLERTVDPTGELAADLKQAADLSDVEAETRDAVEGAKAGAGASEDAPRSPVAAEAPNPNPASKPKAAAKGQGSGRRRRGAAAPKKVAS